MADISLQDFFSGVRLTELMQSEAVKSGIPDVLPPELAKVSGNNPVGTEVQWFEITGNRKLAVLVNQGNAARTADTPGVQRRFATGLGSKEQLVLPQELLYQLKNNVPAMQENARRELVNRVKAFRARFDNLKISLRASVFANGAIYADKTGNVLADSTGAGGQSVNFNVPTANKITKNGAGGTYNIGDWSSAALDIPTKLRTLRTANTRTNGYKLSTILYGQNTPSYLTQNTAVQDYLKRNQVLNAKFLDSNEIPDGVLGWKWRPVSEMFFDDQNGTTKAWFPDNFIGVMPDVSDDWYEYFECGTLIPKGVASPGMSFDQMMELIEVAYGMFAYAEMSMNPLAAVMNTGWYGLPTLKVPGTYYFGTNS